MKHQVAEAVLGLLDAIAIAFDASGDNVLVFGVAGFAVIGANGSGGGSGVRSAFLISRAFSSR